MGFPIALNGAVLLDPLVSPLMDIIKHETNSESQQFIDADFAQC